MSTRAGATSVADASNLIAKTGGRVSTRRFRNTSTEELDLLVACNWNLIGVLQEIAHELIFRERTKAIHLRQNVNRRISELQRAHDADNESVATDNDNVYDNGSDGSDDDVDDADADDALHDEIETLSARFKLWPWQRRAIKEWCDVGSRGVIQAVTGTGKTRVGVAVVEMALSRRMSIAIIVPTRVLLDQWIEDLRQWFPKRKIGRLGDGSCDSIVCCDILVATASSASQRRLPLGKSRGLIIADECHHYGAEQWSKALKPQFEWRLGLTATLERSDCGIEEVLEPYLGRVCYDLGFDEALSEKIIAEFKIALVPTKLMPDEKKTYDDAVGRMTDANKSLLVMGAVELNLAFGDFMKKVAILAGSDDSSAKMAARRYLKAFNDKRSVLADARGKMESLGKIVVAIERADRALIFTQTKKATEDAAYMVPGAIALHSDHDRQERAKVLEALRRGQIKAIVAPRILDEGLNVPACDFGVILASSRTRRQMIQRMGRILRKKPDGRLARLVVYYVEGTGEDPEFHKGESFIETVKRFAFDTRKFQAEGQSRELCDYLCDWLPY